MGPPSAYAKQAAASWSLEQMLSWSGKRGSLRGWGQPGPRDTPGPVWHVTWREAGAEGVGAVCRGGGQLHSAVLGPLMPLRLNGVHHAPRGCSWARSRPRKGPGPGTRDAPSQGAPGRLGAQGRPGGLRDGGGKAARGEGPGSRQPGLSGGDKRAQGRLAAGRHQSGQPCAQRSGPRPRENHRTWADALRATEGPAGQRG